MTKDQWIRLGSEREGKFRHIAEALGKKHPITVMMGSLAWGRHDWEMGQTPNLQSAIHRAAALEGAFYVVNLWARDHDTRAQRAILDIWYGRGDKP